MNSTITIVATIAAFVSTFMAYVRLISDNDGRITDFRKDWNESLRKSVAELNASILGIYGRISVEEENSNEVNVQKELRKDLFPDWKNLRASESFILLHLNKIEPFQNLYREKYQTIANCRLEIDDITKYIKKLKNFDIDNLKEHEEKFTHYLISSMHCTIRLLEDKDYSKIRHEKEHIYNGVNAITFFSGQLLKITWERVKEGEKNTRKALNIFWIISSLIIFIFGLSFIFPIKT